jgi:hypothetical protein
VTKKWEANEVGCIIEGHNGWRVTGILIDIAADQGFKPSDEWLAIRDQFFEGDIDDEFETIAEEADRAENWMNENLAIDDHVFTWFDGEFYYCKVEDEDFTIG